MDLLLIELLLWGGLVFFFWALKDGLGHIETDIESLSVLDKSRSAGKRPAGVPFIRPERVFEPIGSYQDTQIHRYAVINGRTCQFDRVCPAQSKMMLAEDEYYVAPGLVYRECS